MAGHDFGVDHRGVQLAVLLGLPRGRVLHLSRDSVWWWEKLEGIHNNISNDKHVYLQFGHLELKSPGKEKRTGGSMSVLCLQIIFQASCLDHIQSYHWFVSGRLNELNVIRI